MTVFLASGVLLAWAQAQKLGMTRNWDYTSLTKVPEKARARRNPLQPDVDSVAAGKKLFDQHCSECHGLDARGGMRGPSLCVIEVKKSSPGAQFFVLTNGVIRRGMPGWSKLPEPERWQIVTFLESLHE